MVHCQSLLLFNYTSSKPFKSSQLPCTSLVRSDEVKIFLLKNAVRLIIAGLFYALSEKYTS